MSCAEPGSSSTIAEDGATIMPRKLPLARNSRKLCIRCKKLKPAYIVRNITYCQQCFLSALNQRFLKYLYPPLHPDPSPSTSNLHNKGKMRTPNPGQSTSQRPRIQSGKVLICVSGGCGSMTMLDVLNEGGMVGKGDGKRADRSRGEREVIWDGGVVLYIEFASVSGLQDRMEEMRRIADDRELGFIGLRVEDVYDENLITKIKGIQETRNGDDTVNTLDSRPTNGDSHSSSVDQIRRMLVSYPEHARPQILQLILFHLIDTVTSSLPGISHVLIGETSTREAQRVISGTALGRGWALPLELAGSSPITTNDSSPAQHPTNGSESGAQVIENHSTGRGKRIKPMKDISVKEAAIYCHLKRLETVNERKWVNSSKEGNRTKATSLEMLTEQFIASLSVTHPSTVSTINKTGDKLVFPGNIKSKKICPVCQIPSEVSAKQWKSQTALTSLGKGPSNLNEPSNTADQKQDTNTSSDTEEDVFDNLCYSCFTTFTTSGNRAKERGNGLKGDGPNLPPWVNSNMRSGQTRREEMKTEISEFLLDDTD